MACAARAPTAKGASAPLVPTNAYIPAPASPGWWVSDAECACGAKYRESRFGIRWRMGVDLVRAANGGFDSENGGGYKSAGPVLWAMRVLKLDLWYQTHRACEPF
jgi:hypothetical protein